MFYSSEVSQAFYAVISLHFAVVACLPSRPLYTCVSPSPGTCNSRHNVLPVLLKILRMPTKPTALIIVSASVSPPPQNPAPHLAARRPVLPPSPPIPPPQSAALQCTFLAPTVCTKILSARRASHSNLSPCPACSGRCISRHQGLSKERHVENISTSGEPSIRVCNQLRNAFP